MSYRIRSTLPIEQREAAFMGLLAASDYKLMAMDLGQLREALSSNADTEHLEGHWTPALAQYFIDLDPQDLLRLIWAVEKHYAAHMRQSTSDAELNRLYLIGYARVISLMLRLQPQMGYSLDDLQFILSLLQHHMTSQTGVSDPHILEVGCGAGDLLIDLAQHGYHNSVGIDIAPAAIRLARSKLHELNLSIGGLYCASLPEFCAVLPDSRFDLIIHCHLIEHLVPAQVPAFLELIARCLSPDGYMVVITPSKLTGPHDNTRFFKPHGSEPEGFHLREYCLRDLKQLLSHAGFGHFMAMNSLPYANSYWDAISEENFQTKLRMEPLLEHVEWKLRKPLMDGLYFQALACQKMNAASG